MRLFRGNKSYRIHRITNRLIKNECVRRTGMTYPESPCVKSFTTRLSRHVLTEG